MTTVMAAAVLAAVLAAQAPADGQSTSERVWARLFTEGLADLAADAADPASPLTEEQQERRDRLTDYAIAAAGSGAFLDTAGSIACLSQRTCHELNKWMTGDPLAFGAIKAAANTLIVWVLLRLRKTHPVLVRTVALSYAALNVYLGVRAARYVE